MIRNKPRFSFCKNQANKTLILQNALEFPIDILNLKINDKIRIVSYSQISDITGHSINEITGNGEYNDAIKYEHNGIILLAYNDKIDSLGRIRWSIAHEYGHIVLDHKEQNDINEVEANTFAAQLLLPECILKFLIKKRGNITLDYLINKFGISKQAAEKYIHNISKKIDTYYSDEYDDIILFLANSFLQNETKNSYYNLIDEEEKQQIERENW